MTTPYTGFALDWTVSEWLNTPPDFTPDDLAGRVVLAAGFQMLCPGCVDQTIPQLKRADSLFPSDQVAVVALHTVFEHHDVMTPNALRAFLHEYRVSFPVAIDTPDPAGGRIPITMGRYQMQGTPTILLYDQNGQLRRQTFGHVPDLELGFQVGQLLSPAPTPTGPAGP